MADLLFDLGEFFCHTVDTRSMLASERLFGLWFFRCRPAVIIVMI